MVWKGRFALNSATMPLNLDRANASVVPRGIRAPHLCRS